MKIAIITDGNNTFGMGHVYQSVTLAGELSKKMDSQSKVFFITKSDHTVVDQISKTGLQVYQYPHDDVILKPIVCSCLLMHPGLHIFKNGIALEVNSNWKSLNTCHPS